jgi:hypothetical protein
MAQHPSTKEMADEIVKRGAFRAFEYFVETGRLTTEEARQWTARIYEFFLKKTREAQNEVRRIDAVLARISQLSEGGRVARHWMARDPRLIQLAEEVMTLDGWVMSLYETDLTMLGFGAPERGRAKAHEMAKSMDALWAKRLAELNLGLNAPDLFKIR